MQIAHPGMIDQKAKTPHRSQRAVHRPFVELASFGQPATKAAKLFLIVHRHRCPRFALIHHEADGVGTNIDHRNRGRAIDPALIAEFVHRILVVVIAGHGL